MGEAANCFIECRDKDTSFGSQVYLGAVGDDMVIFANGYQALRLTSLGVLNVANSACVLDEDAMGSNSAVHLCTQQSIKKYVDDEVAAGPGGWTYGSQVATTSGTTKVLTTAIPSDATEIEVIIKQVSINTSARAVAIQLGDSGGYEGFGYESACMRDTGSGTGGFVATDSFIMATYDVMALGDDLTGVARLTRWDSSENTWICTGTANEWSTGAAAYAFPFSGIKTLSGTLTSIRLFVHNGTGSFDAGEARVRWR